MVIFKVVLCCVVINFVFSCQENVNNSTNEEPTESNEKLEKEIGEYKIGKYHARFPPYFDWRDKDMVSPVKDQGSCNACAVFSAVANIESQVKIQKGVEETLSEQFVIDCDNTTQGCSPSSLLKTFGNIIANYGGVLRECDYYPYTQKKQECRWDRKVAPVPVIGLKRVFPDEAAMVQELINHGPLSAAINAKRMVKYKGNYIDEPSDEDCPPDELDHCVLIVGYNTYVSGEGNTVPYWIIKNSWGTNWGDHGYYYLVRGRNACGISRDVSYAIVG